MWRPISAMATSVMIVMSSRAPVVASAPLEIPPAPMLWVMPVDNGGVGRAWFLAHRNLGLCLSCVPCEFEDLVAVFTNPGPLGRVAGCGVVVQDSLIEIDRLETIRLQSVGSTASVPVALRPIVFTWMNVQVHLFEACEGMEVTSLKVFAPVGSMTIRRDSETGGTFELQFSVLVDLSLRSSWPRPPFTHTVRLGPYSVAMENVRWGWGAPTSSFCRSCSGEFSITSALNRPYMLLGYGTSPGSQLGDPIHLDQSMFYLALSPLCATRLTPVHQGSWSRVKELFK